MAEAADARALREQVRTEVRNVLWQYARLKSLLNAASSITMKQVVDELGFVPNAERLSDVRAWVLTLDIVIASVDRAIGVKNACEAAGQRLICNMSFQKIADHVLHRPKKRCEEIVDDAIAALLTEIISRGITEDYKSLSIAA